MSDEIDLGIETSQLLTEVRTVLSRAETALYGYRGDPSWISEAKWWIEPQRPVFGSKAGGGRGEFLGYSDGVSIPHPDRDEIREALEKVVELLKPWARTGRKKKRG